MLNASKASSHITGKRVTLESGSNNSNTVSEKTILSKSDPQVVGHQQVNDSVVMTGEHSGFQTYHPSMLTNTNGVSGYSALAPDDKKLARQVMKELDKKARLFARDESEQLVRISPATAKQMLDGGESIEVVRALGKTTSSTGRSRHASFHMEHIFIPDDYAKSSSSNSRHTVAVNYSSSEVNDWDALTWHEGEDFSGVPGTARLPKSGNSVTVSEEFERKWQQSSAEHWGFFRVTTDAHSSSGYERQKTVAEG